MAPKMFLETKERKLCPISDLMEKFGKYQIIQYTLICLPALLITMININYVFVVGDLKYRCQIDECEDANSTAEFPSWWPDTNINRCFKPVLKTEETVCTNRSFTGELTTCHRWIYENNNTVVAALDLACRPWHVNLVGTVHNVGMLISMVVSGWLCDKFGRKPIFIISIVTGCFGTLKIFATSYYLYIFLEFLEALFTGGCYSAATVILLEITGCKYRLLSGVIFAYAIYFGESLFACLAMFVPYWKSMIYIMNGPCIIFIIYIFFINESPRWLIVNGRTEKAKEIMKRIAEMNRLHVNDEELDTIDEATLKKQFNIDEAQISESYVNIFRSSEILKRLVVAGACRFASSFVYYGLMLDSVYLPGDKYLNFLLSTVMSFPGELISLYLMYKVGRKIPLICGYFICGVLCIISALIPASYLWTKLSMFLIGKLLIAACFTGAITYTMELFPTSVRATLLALGDFTCRLGGLLAPLTPMMNSISHILPFVCFGSSAILAAVLLFLTPETKNLPIFDTIKQIECHVNNSKENKELRR